MNLNETFKAVRAASRKLAMMDAQTINTVLCAVADKIEEKTDVLLKANQEDLLRMETSNPEIRPLEADAGTFGRNSSRYASGGFFAFTVRNSERSLYGTQRTSFTEGERAVWGDRSNL